MPRNEIDGDVYAGWASTKWVEYASESIPPRATISKRLRFMVSVSGVYRVTLGDETLYEGAHFEQAKETYEGV